MDIKGMNTPSDTACEDNLAEGLLLTATSFVRCSRMEDLANQPKYRGFPAKSQSRDCSLLDQSFSATFRQRFSHDGPSMSVN
jgi:hypothetical protein